MITYNYIIHVFTFQNFRDSHNAVLNRISSYALKSVVMNIILERPSKVWDRANIQEHFLEALDYIKERCSRFPVGNHDLKVRVYDM